MKGIGKRENRKKDKRIVREVGIYPIYNDLLVRTHYLDHHTCLKAGAATSRTALALHTYLTTRCLPTYRVAIP